MRQARATLTGRILLVATAACLLTTTACLGASGAGEEEDANVPTTQACRLLTAEDVRSTLGVEVAEQQPAPPPPATSTARLVGACTYAAGDTAAGASLYLFRDLPAATFGRLPGYQPVPGIGERAFAGPSVLVAQKGETTFQVVVVARFDQGRREQALRALGSAVARRL